jgi:muramoyltetrapeptide carboxypeptidase LdcA involved in peptidoglycan recycling
VLREGEASGTILGANLCTLQLLHGTPFMPHVDGDVILFVEDCYEDSDVFALNFDRDLQSVMHQDYFQHVKGIVIGRFEHATNMDMDKLRKIVLSKKELGNIPIIAGADFGHTYPMITFPIGGKVRIEASHEKSHIYIVNH